MIVPRDALDLALPLVKSFPESADFSKTVEPYLPQLYALPYRIFQSLNSWQALQNVYLTTNPLMTAFAFSIFLSPVVFVVAEVNRNYSQVDRLWSLLPSIYNIHYCLWAHANGLSTLRVDHIMAVSVMWSIRLTFNYWRKGGYSVGSEDYRWNVVKDRIGPLAMFVFDFTFIAFIQNVSLCTVSSYPDIND